MNNSEPTGKSNEISAEQFAEELEVRAEEAKQHMASGQPMIRYARQAVNEVFQMEYVRIQGYMIVATRKKIGIIQKMLDGMENIEKRLFDENMINTCKDPEQLIRMFCALADKVVTLGATVNQTYGLIKQIGEILPEYEQTKSFSNLVDRIQNQPESRKRLLLAMQVMVGALKHFDDPVEKAKRIQGHSLGENNGQDTAMPKSP